MQNKNLAKEAKLILAIVGNKTRNKCIPSVNLDNLKGIDWSLLKEMIIYHELAPFAYTYFKSSPFTLPKEIMEFLEEEYHYSLCQNFCFQKEFLRLNHKFLEKDLIMVPIKGLALLEDIYKQNPIRPMLDIDVLVKEEELEKAEALLIKFGYRKCLWKGSESYWKNKNCNIPFKKKDRNCMLELHFALDLKRCNRNILPDLWKRLRLVKADGNGIKLLSPEDTLFSLALHQRRFGRPFSFKNTLDVALLIDRYKDNFDWDYVLSEAKASKICSTIFFVLLQAHTLLETAIPQVVWKSLKVSFWKRKLIYSFIKKTIFSSHSLDKFKYIYLKSHFLLYDSLWEPVNYILRISQEEFAKFHNLPLYTPETEKLYKVRFLYMPYGLIKDNLRKKKSLLYKKDINSKVSPANLN